MGITKKIKEALGGTAKDEVRKRNKLIRESKETDGVQRARKPDPLARAPIQGDKDIAAVDWPQLENYCRIHCTAAECAALLGVKPAQLKRAILEAYGLTFEEYYDRYAAHGKLSVRRRQFEVAMKGNVPMLVHLGRNWLGQTDEAVRTGSEDKEEGSGLMAVLKQAATDRRVAITGNIQIDVNNGEDKSESAEKQDSCKT